MAAWSWNLSGIEHDILLSETEPVSAMDGELKEEEEGGGGDEDG